jgi:uncharacterized protein YjiS (DUF1127 family)
MMTIDMDLSTNSDRRRFAQVRTAFSAWLGRARERRVLAAMDDRTLRDLGLTRYEIAAEIARSRRWRS